MPTLRLEEGGQAYHSTQSESLVRGTAAYRDRVPPGFHAVGTKDLGKPGAGSRHYSLGNFTLQVHMEVEILMW